jgi:pyruvate/2-oxoglutarate dehydrogenase complex dihydrolipoamide dehydrogenase (E3) component
MLTPVASYEGRVATRNALKGNHEKVDYSLVTRTTFTHPPVASISPTEAEAKERGISYNVKPSGKLLRLRHGFSRREKRSETY